MLNAKKFLSTGIGLTLAFAFGVGGITPAVADTSPADSTIQSSDVEWKRVWTADLTKRDTSVWNIYDQGPFYDLNEKQYSHPDQVQFENHPEYGGILNIKAQEIPTHGHAYRSGQLNSRYKLSLPPYGRFSWDMNSSSGDGVSAAMVLYGDDMDQVGWPWSGEMDLVEGALNSKTHPIWLSVHGPGYSGGNPIGRARDASLPHIFGDGQWHHFETIWTPDSIQTFVDGQAFGPPITPADTNGNPWVFNKPVFISIPVTVGSYTSGPIDTSTWPLENGIPTARVSYANIHLDQPVTPAFTDIKDSPFKQDIIWMKERGIATGYQDGTYRPLEPVNRDAMAAFVYRMAGKPAYSAPGSPSFHDVSLDNPFYKEIEWMKSSTLATGWSDNSYRPLNTVSREAMAAFMYRYAGEYCNVQSASEYTAPSNPSFNDIGSSAFKKEIEWMKSSGISTGYEDGTYRPFENVSREAMAAFMHRLDGYIQQNSGCNP